MQEKVYKGIVASPGVVIGRAYLLDRRKIVVAGQRIEDVSVKDEVSKCKEGSGVPVGSCHRLMEGSP